MTRRERLMRTLEGKAVDRPPVCFYEIDAVDQDPADPDPFNVFNDPSWLPLLELTRDRTDRIVMRGVPFNGTPPDPLEPLRTFEEWEEDGSRFERTAIRAGGRVLTTVNRRDPEIYTIWTVEHLLKDVDDFQAWLELPQAKFGGVPEPSDVILTEEELGDSGIVCIDTPDPLCQVAPLFDMGTYMLIATTENALMHRALEKVASVLLPRVEAVAKALSGRLWRIFGPEYASPPYLPPTLFEEYVTRYVTPMVAAIQRYGGYARVHSHGNLRDILDLIAATGCSGLDPIEPPPQGDVTLGYVRERYGDQMVLFGNLEVSDIENMPAAQFAEKVATALREGTMGRGRGLVVMPSSAPYGRTITPLTMRNYEEMVRQVETFSGS